jgi:hypothetical protein
VDLSLAPGGPGALVDCVLLGVRAAGVRVVLDGTRRDGGLLRYL